MTNALGVCCRLRCLIQRVAVALALLSTVVLLRASPAFEDFVGSEACAGCHQKQYNLWKDSTHGRAGGNPGEAKIIARFDGQPMRFTDATVTPRINAQGKYEFVLEQPGVADLEITV